MRLLLVEDNIALADQLLPLFKGHGYAIDWLVDGRDAVLAPHDNSFDLAILDLGLPGLDGLKVLECWRSEGLTLPVLILTARDSWAERLEGLRAGADDYLSKPFHPDELLLRVQAVLRRSHGTVNNPRLEVGELALDESRQSVWQSGQEYELTRGEFRLLRCFMLNPGRVLTRMQLNDHLYDGESERDSNVLEVHVSRLRRKLGEQIIETRRGQGYCFLG
ncbi:response regulator transcription factor [Candidatus Nitrosacidococcus tergens]|uniref:Transcriptional regulatory protein QseB n=1 Tax=Candidatus Nitrosacidococcus tergens TaxID=553981 RepID=A0A7G1QA99_9GAMM|nr:response regulator transcription factor [Candidatus Nitrosacidococcus tergens]CAB1276384.1 Transcriptional regulatory protein QseB [Candidatus Nitrosacidococcus tergens]